MLGKFRPRLSYANVVATLALFLAVGGSAYAAATIGSAQIVNNSIRSVDVRDKTSRGGGLTGADIKEWTLGKVPNASKLDGHGAQDFKVRCPAGTSPFAGSCVESSLRPAADWSTASLTCAAAGRRLPSPDELYARLAGTPGEQPNEWSGSEYDDANGSGASAQAVQGHEYTYGPNEVGSALQGVAPSSLNGYRCVAMPSN